MSTNGTKQPVRPSALDAQATAPSSETDNTLITSDGREAIYDSPMTTLTDLGSARALSTDPAQLDTRTDVSGGTNGVKPSGGELEAQRGTRSQRPPQSDGHIASVFGVSWTSRFRAPQSTAVYHAFLEQRRPTPPPERQDSGPKFPPETQWTTAALMQASEELFQTIPSSKEPSTPKTCILNIAALLRLSVLGYQEQIAVHARKVLSGQEVADAERDVLLRMLHHYCKWIPACVIKSRRAHRTAGEMIRDIEYSEKVASKYKDDDERDPFLMRSSRAIDRMIMKRAELIPHHVGLAGELPPARDAAQPQLPIRGRNPGIRKSVSRRNALRFLMAVAGGLFLIIPMVIMVFVRTREASVATTCCAIFLAALALAACTDLGPNEVLATCAAYGAVLVVFVGASLPVIEQSSRQN
jgi:hypothetical protein